MKTAVNFHELKTELASMGFIDPSLVNDLRETMYYLQKSNIMNTENLAYLNKQLLNLGFGEGMNKELEKNIGAKTPEFTLTSTNEYNKQNVDYTLHFKAGDQNDMYFLISTTPN